MKIEPPHPADLVTLLNGFTGLLAIMYIIDGNFMYGMLLILLGILIDGADGAIAQLFRRKGGHGVYLDSIADMVTFCFAPSVLLYTMFYDLALGSSFQSPENALTVAASMLVALFGILRLARFVEKDHKSTYFIGLPTPAAALTIVMAVSVVENQLAALVIAILVSILMISRIRYPRLHGTLVAAAALIIIVGLLAILFPMRYSIFARAFVLLMAIVYVLIGPLYANASGVMKDG